jgi:hypothetical protein
MSYSKLFLTSVGQVAADYIFGANGVQKVEAGLENVAHARYIRRISCCRS